MIRSLIATGIAASLAASPVFAEQTNVQRESAPVASESQLGGSTLMMLVGIAVIAASIFFLSEDNDPVSA